MTDSSLRSGSTISLGERPPVPDVVLRGAVDRLDDPLDDRSGPGSRPGSDSPGLAPVDGVAVFFVDPGTGGAHVVFASEGLAGMVGVGVDDLLGRDPAVLFHQGGSERLSEICRELGLDGQRQVEAEMVARAEPLLARTPLPRRHPERRAGPAIDLDAIDGVPTIDVPLTDLPLTDLPLSGMTVPPDPITINPAANPPVGRMVDPQALDPASIPAVAPAGLGLEESRRGLDPDLLERLAPLGDLSELTRDGDDRARRFRAPQELARRDRPPLPVHATYGVVPSMTPSAPYVVAEFRDLEQPSVERLLADQAAVVRSLGRGYELGRVCHQVAAEVERELGDGSRCWVTVQVGDGTMEPILSGGLPFDMVQGAVTELLQLGDPLTRRVVSIAALTEMRTRHLQNCSITTLWYLPLAAESDLAQAGTHGGSNPAVGAVEAPTGNTEAGSSDPPPPVAGAPGSPLRGAMVIATPRPRPTRAQARALEHLAAVLHTAVEQATVEAELAHQTLHDPLTGLPNRALLVDRLGQVMARLERDDVALSVLLVDIDRFRSVNDSRGAEIGDRVLREVAGRLLTAVRLGDTVGRLSSDQYLVMCAAHKGELDAKSVARRILRSLAEPISIGEGDELHITASIGVVVVDEPGSNPAAIISSAESALARASAAGRGRMAMFEADHRHHQVEQHVLEQALHRAIGTDELVIHYQPLVEIRTGYMVGAEALVRWDRPGHGMVSPGDFIPIAEESELIIPLGKWIIDQVCRDLGRWPRSHGRSPMVTINLGARQLGADTLVPTVISALRRNRLHPRQVGFEITESMEIRDAEAAVINLNRLKELGCRIAIDDFGIGHATLEYIRRFSMADALKIDRSFVAGLGNSREDTAIVDASIALASSLRLQVIAEGVEALDQLHGLRERGARYAQGYALARPMPFDQVLALWRRQRLYDPPWETIVGNDGTTSQAMDGPTIDGRDLLIGGQLPNRIGTGGG